MPNAYIIHARLAWQLAWKAKIQVTMAYFVAAMVLAVLLVVEFSARQLATVALDIGISVMRIALPFAVVLLAQELFSREFDKKLSLTSLTFPASRATWLLARMTIVFLYTLALMLIMAAILALLTTYVGSTYAQATPVGLGVPYAITLGFLSMDVLSAVVIASLLAMSVSTPSMVMIGTFGFILIARSYTAVIALLQSNPYTVAEHVDPKLYQDSLSMLAFVLPDLGRLDVRMIALYNTMDFLPGNWAQLLLATAMYVMVVAALAMWTLNRREFQ